MLRVRERDGIVDTRRLRGGYAVVRRRLDDCSHNGYAHLRVRERDRTVDTHRYERTRHDGRVLIIEGDDCPVHDLQLIDHLRRLHDGYTTYNGYTTVTVHDLIDRLRTRAMGV